MPSVYKHRQCNVRKFVNAQSRSPECQQRSEQTSFLSLAYESFVDRFPQPDIREAVPCSSGDSTYQPKAEKRNQDEQLSSRTFQFSAPSIPNIRTLRAPDHCSSFCVGLSTRATPDMMHADSLYGPDPCISQKADRQNEERTQ